MSIEEFLILLLVFVLGGMVGFAFGYGEAQREACRGYALEQLRLENQAEEYQKRFDKWCETQKHKCKIMKGKPI